ncbi:MULTISPECIES: SCP2 sterol-binding domain-containing protein [Streptomyces]|uniref:SCP2 sterol-binding domain-containing protein n=1 Tax=Streptomyces arenae TaxID=29301 RepID=UPI0010DC1F09|nr:SCP2 sterol-binding domain-containing protein [Streptomyces arenae]MCG7206183.1 SCP2 sterol-binding domain-containing protein [Streptomyces arenae]
MAVFESTEVAERVFGTLFEILLKDEQFTSQLRAGDMSVLLTQTNPDCVLHVSADALTIGADAPEQATIRIKMSSDTAHQLWLGKLMMPTAIATGRVRIRGKVARVLELVPILRPAFDRYPELAEKEGLPL